MRYIASLLALCFNVLFAEESSPSLIDINQSPIPRVAGSVTLVSGNFIDQTLSHETSGIDSYQVASSYVSSK